MAAPDGDPLRAAAVRVAVALDLPDGTDLDRVVDVAETAIILAIRECPDRPAVRLAILARRKNLEHKMRLHRMVGQALDLLSVPPWAGLRMTVRRVTDALLDLACQMEVPEIDAVRAAALAATDPRQETNGALPMRRTERRMIRSDPTRLDGRGGSKESDDEAETVDTPVGTGGPGQRRGGQTAAPPRPGPQPGQPGSAPQEGAGTDADDQSGGGPVAEGGG